MAKRVPGGRDKTNKSVTHSNVNHFPPNFEDALTSYSPTTSPGSALAKSISERDKWYSTLRDAAPMLVDPRVFVHAHLFD